MTPAHPSSLSGNEDSYRRLFRMALMIRRVEERIISIYASDRIQSPVHLSNGQEAVAAGLCDSLSADDWLYATYRSHAFFLAKGGSLRAMFAELYGKQDGGSKGKAGSMHLTAPEVGLMGSTAVVASNLPHAVGSAFTFKQRGEARIAVAALGDGATEEGVFHESLNLACLHKLPVLFLCEDNGYAVHATKAVRQSYDITALAGVYGAAVSVIENGFDLLAVRDHLAAVTESVRNGGGPAFVLVKTYRYKEHVGPGDDFSAGYRSHQEYEAWAQKDALLQDRTLYDALVGEVDAAIDDAMAFAEASPWPGQEDLLTDVDAPDPQDLQAGTWGAEVTGPISYRQALYLSMEGALRDRSDAFITGQGVDDHKGIFGTTLGLPERFGANRVFDVPIAEEGMTGFALGTSLAGFYPITTHIRADFLLLATNQIINLIAKYRYMFGGRFQAPMLIRAVIGRSWGQGGQHSQSLQSLYAHIPGLTVIMPSDSTSVLQSYEYAIRHYQGPVISFEHRLLYDLEFETNQDILTAPCAPFSSRLLRQGRDITIVATSIMVLEARRAATHLANLGIDCEIIDLHCISHPDEDMILDSVARTGRLIIADTSWTPFGVAADICRIISTRAPDSLKSPIITLGMQPSTCPTAKALEDLFYPSLSDFCAAIIRQVTGKDPSAAELPSETSMADIYKRFKGPF
jgi:pyruvate/2-oxoglutarate/acetoin dehydrogenase E1 component/TPP-dependent pyruvate/acetoin dehydrogenase alpha subunit